jgi:hypothetical protein
MKNLKYIVISAIALSFTASSCKKSFLDEQPSEQVSTTQEQGAIKQDPSLLGARVLGLYSTMYATGSGGSNLNHDDYGQKGYDVYSDMLASDIVLGATNYGWYTSLIRYQDTKNNASASDSQAWRYYFKLIYGANIMIDVLGGNDVVLTDATLKHYMGQAKAIRAYSYFYLANLFSAKGYGTGSERILPINLTSNDVSKPLSTSAEVYNQMVKDLTESITLLSDFSRGNKGQIDASVAKGILAYVYAARGTNDDLAKVITLTDDVLADYPLTTQKEVVGNFDANGRLTNAEAGFNSLGTPSWMWGADITLSSGLDLVSWWGQMDIYTYSYAWAGDPKFIDDKLYAAIRPDDVRKKQFFDNAPPYTDEHAQYGGLLPQGKFFNAARIEGGQRNVTDDYIYMRSDEMLLLNAEAKARLNQDADAKIELKKLLSLRVTDPTYVDALSGNALKEEIYLQTRIELWGEGKTYLAMKRNKHSITRGTNHLFLAGQTFTYDAPDLTFPIPSAEVLYNPNLNK